MFGATGSPLAQRLLGLINRNPSRSDKPIKRLWLGAFVALLIMACLVSCSQATKPSPTLSSSLGQSDTSLLEEVPNAPDLRMLIWEWQGCDTCTADLRLNFDQSLDAFRESSGKKVELAVVDPLDYSLRLNTSLQSEPYAHLIWISQEMLPDLVEEGRILPLDEFYAAHPEVAADLPEASLARFRLNGQLYGIPLGPAEEWNWNAYAITRQSVEAGKAELAFELLSFLRARVPPHGLPELIIERLLSEPENPSMGESFEFIAAIRNAGEANAENVVVAFYTPNGDLIGEQVVDFIEPGAVEFTSVQAVYNQSDLAWFHVEIDPQRIIPETNKRNNSGYFPFGTGPGAPSTPVAASQPFCIDSKAYQSSYNGMSPKVAFDGTNYLVIWAKQQSPFTGTYAHQIYGARVSSSGTVIDTNGFVIASKVGKYDSFNLAFDGTNYLVVWELEKSGVGSYTVVDPATILYGARVSKAGKVLDSTPFVIEQGTTPASEYSQFWHRWPVVVYTGSDFMVIYYTSTEDGSGHSKDHTEDGVYARRVSKAGVVSSKQQLVQSLNSKTYYGLLDFAFKQAQAFLFMGGRTGTTAKKNIYGSWVSGFSASTLTVTTPLKLASDGPVYSWPFGRGAVAAGNANQYLTVWEYSLNKSWPDLHFGVATGSAFSNKTALVKGTNETYPSIAFDGTNYLTIYSHTVGCLAYLGAVHVDTNGAPGTPTYFNASTTWADLVYDTDVAFGSNNFLAIFANQVPASSPGAGDWYFQVCGQLVQKSQ